MANPEHLSILEQGITHWNRWRRKNLYNITPDLIEADLSGKVLREIDLRGVDLSYADLRRADLSEANLTRANLSNVDLKGAKLIEADLSNADLRGTYLNRANLSYSDFRGANLGGANINKVCLKGWKINAETNLRNIKCDYFFCEYNKYSTSSFSQPYPQNRIFEIGEFEKLVKEEFETIDLTVHQEVNWQAFSEFFEQLKVKTEEGENLHIEDIEKKEDGTYIVQIQVPSAIDREEFTRTLEQRYQAEVELVKSKYKQDLEIKNTEINSQKRENKTLTDVNKLLAKQKTTNVENKTTINYDNSQGKININSGGGQVNRIATNENNQSIQGNNNKVNSNQLRDNATQQVNSTPEQPITISDVLGINIPEILGNAQNLIFSWQVITIAISSLLALFVWFHQTYFNTPETEQPKQTQPEFQLQQRSN